MDIESFRNYCLSLGEVEERLPFEKFFRGRHSFLAFYAGGRMFCFFDIDRFDCCTLKCPPAEVEPLKEAYQAVGKPYNCSPKHWISVRLGGDVDDALLRRLVRQAYETVRASGRVRRGG